MNAPEHKPPCGHTTFSGPCACCQAARQERWSEQLAAAIAKAVTR